MMHTLKYFHDPKPEKPVWDLYMHFFYNCMKVSLGNYC